MGGETEAGACVEGRALLKLMPRSCEAAVEHW